MNAVARKLIAAGLVANEYILELNRGLQIPDDTRLTGMWALPSRMFQFPVCVSSERDTPEGHEPHVWMRHPELRDHPLRERVERALGHAVALGPQSDDDAYRYGTGQWWHACDLAAAGLWEPLFETRRFTTDQDIAHAVTFCLRCHPGEERMKAAYAAMDQLGAKRPNGNPEAAPQWFLEPSPCNKSWPVNDGKAINSAADAIDHAWAMIQAIERGYMSKSAHGGLRWTQQGIAAWYVAHGKDPADHGAPESSGPQQSTLGF